MSAGASALTNSENYYSSSLQEQQDKNKYKVKGEEEQVTHDDFLTLLVTQMQNQDPLSPMEDTQMMSQFAQLQQLDNQTSMTKAMVDMRNEYAMQGASTLIGKKVYIETENGSTTNGEVVQTLMSDDSVQLVLGNGQTVDYSDVVKVENIEEPPSIQDASGMMQKYVVGVDEDGNAFEGIVKNVTTQGSVVYIETYEGDFIPMEGVAQIRELTGTENNQLQEALSYVNQYIESPREDEDGNPDGVNSGVVKEIYRKDGQYWAETWGGQGVYLKDVTMHQDLSTEEMADLEKCKSYTNSVIKGCDGNMLGLAEGFFYKDGEFYMYTAHSEAVHVDDIYLTRSPTPGDMIDFGSTDGMAELDLLNMQNAIEDYLGQEYTGYDADYEQHTGKITSVYFKSPIIYFRLDDGSDVISPASIINNGENAE